MVFFIKGFLLSISSVLSSALTAGPAGSLWGCFVFSFFILLIGLSMAENGSSAPTSGGHYSSANYYAPPNLKTLIFYVVGNTLAVVPASEVLNDRVEVAHPRAYAVCE